MSALHRWFNLAGVLLPFIGFVLAVVLLWNKLVDWSDLAVMLIMYVISGYGVTLGFHRLLTHRSFQTFKPVEYTFAILGSMAVQGPVMSWVADHRKHHAHTDQEGDPHSPHGHGACGALPASGTPTWAGCSTSPAPPSTPATPATSTRTAACASSTARSAYGCSSAC